MKLADAIKNRPRIPTPVFFIVKVQLSLGSTHPNRRCLIYNKSHSVMYEADADDQMLRLMGDSPKAFFYAHLDGTIVVIGRKAREQSW